MPDSVLSMAEVQRQSKGFFFSEDTTRFFRSRYADYALWCDAAAGWVFTYSNKQADQMREYRLGVLAEDGTVNGRGGWYSSLRKAEAALQRLHDSFVTLSAEGLVVRGPLAVDVGMATGFCVTGNVVWVPAQDVDRLGYILRGLGLAVPDLVGPDLGANI